MNLLEHLQRQLDLTRTQTPPAHGGRLQTAMAGFPFPEQDWLDLSTGINPEPWPVPKLNAELWQRLPENQEHLKQVAWNYYLADTCRANPVDLVPIPGSQWFIQHFPSLIARILPPRSRPVSVLIPDTGYSEHRYWWQHHGHQVESYHEAGLAELLTCRIQAQVLVIINPNNPSTRLLTANRIRAAAEHNPDTLIIVDEAFIDTRPEHSLLQESPADNLIVLRSLGKFFGLAGLRVGFCIANKTICELINIERGPWPLATASEQLAIQALEDRAWQARAREQLKQLSQELKELLQARLPQCRETADIRIHCSDLFITLECSSAHQTEWLYNAMLKEAVLLRHFSDLPRLRVGLAGALQLPELEKRLRKALACR